MRLRITFRLRKLLSSIHRFLPKRIKRLVKILLRPARKVLEALLKLTYPIYPVNPVFGSESPAPDWPITEQYQPSRYSYTQKGSRAIDPTKETILLISHEGSRTGAPILTYNLAKSFQNKYNIVFILLYPGGSGSIWESFLEEGCLVAGPGARGSYELAENIVEELVESFNFKFAIANSVETYLVLPFLVKHHIPVITLIHEFASIYKSTQIFQEIFLWSSSVVFSNSLTLENCKEVFPDLKIHHTHILPQGRCATPHGKGNQDVNADRDQALKEILRPKDSPSDELVVIGLGTIEMRKGIDLFIECAAAIVRSGLIPHCRFVWIGYGYNINDLSYSFFLHEQIKRSGLESNVFIVDAVPDLKVAYEEADIVLISSRLDPLPNVGIDAMFYKKPVVCFEKATGLTDIFIKNDLGNECVAKYMDTMHMANKVMALAQSESLRHHVGLRLEQIAIELFDFEKYALQIEKIGLDAVQYYNQQQNDTITILDSEIVSLDYFLRPGEKMEIKEAVSLYVRAWESQNVRRKLFAGFHPGIFTEQSKSFKPDSDPLAQFIIQGKPDGPWFVQVITPATKPAIIPDSLRIALHIHVYYPDLLLRILKRLNRNELSPDLFISVSHHLDLIEIQEILSREYKGKVIKVQSVPNKGRDIGPFFTAFGSSLVKNYDIIGHLHTKKTNRIPNETFGIRWFEFLLDNLIGGRHNMADIILGQMALNPLIGLVFPDDPHVLGWDLNKAEAEQLRLQMGLKKLPENIWFPMGNMFWARTESLLPLFNLEFDWELYPDEPIPEDGTILHALERILPLVVSHQEFQIAVTNVEGVNR